MMFKIITMAFDPITKGFDEGVIRQFILNKKVISYKAELFQSGQDIFWTVFLAYDPLVEPTPAARLEDLTESQKLLFERLKAWRKERAEKDGIPVYIVGTNKEFVEIVKKAPKTLEALKTVRGFGQGKISKYGKEIIQIINGFFENER